MQNAMGDQETTDLTPHCFDPEKNSPSDNAETLPRNLANHSLPKFDDAIDTALSANCDSRGLIYENNLREQMDVNLGALSSANDEASYIANRNNHEACRLFSDDDEDQVILQTNVLACSDFAKHRDENDDLGDIEADGVFDSANLANAWTNRENILEGQNLSEGQFIPEQDDADMPLFLSDALNASTNFVIPPHLHSSDQPSRISRFISSDFSSSSEDSDYDVKSDCVSDLVTSSSLHEGALNGIEVTENISTSDLEQLNGSDVHVMASRRNPVLRLELSVGHANAIVNESMLRRPLDPSDTRDLGSIASKEALNVENSFSCGNCSNDIDTNDGTISYDEGSLCNGARSCIPRISGNFSDVDESDPSDGNSESRCFLYAGASNDTLDPAVDRVERIKLVQSGHDQFNTSTCLTAMLPNEMDTNWNDMKQVNGRACHITEGCLNDETDMNFVHECMNIGKEMIEKVRLNSDSGEMCCELPCNKAIQALNALEDDANIPCRVTENIPSLRADQMREAGVRPEMIEEDIDTLTDFDSDMQFGADQLEPAGFSADPAICKDAGCLGLSKALDNDTRDSNDIATTSVNLNVDRSDRNSYVVEAELSTESEDEASNDDSISEHESVSNVDCALTVPAEYLANHINATTNAFQCADVLSSEVKPLLPATTYHHHEQIKRDIDVSEKLTVTFGFAENIESAKVGSYPAACSDSSEVGAGIASEHIESAQVIVDPSTDLPLPAKNCSTDKDCAVDSSAATTERRYSGVSLEQFLIPPLRVVRSVTTPKEDLGFAKVPGFGLESNRAYDSKEPVRCFVSEKKCDVAFKLDIDKEDVILKSSDAQKQFFDVVENASAPNKSIQDAVDDALKFTANGANSVQRSGPMDVKRKGGSLPASLVLPIASGAYDGLSKSPQSRSPRPTSLLGLSTPLVIKQETASKTESSQHSPTAAALSLSGVDPDCVANPILEFYNPLLLRKHRAFDSNESSTHASATVIADDIEPVVELGEEKADQISADGSKPLQGATSLLFDRTGSIDGPTGHRTPTLTLSLPSRPTSWSPSSLSTPPVVQPKRPSSLNLGFSLPAQAESENAVGCEVVNGGEGLGLGGMVGALAGVGRRSRPVVVIPAIAVETSSDGTTGSESVSEAGSLRVDTTPVIAPLTPPLSCNIALAVTDLGRVAPAWLPDAVAPKCMQCETRFTFTRRRHHCRACGKVFCNGCCNIRTRLEYLGPKEARVCSRCFQDLQRGLSCCSQTHFSKFYQHPIVPPYRTGRRPDSVSAAGATLATPPPGVLRKEGSLRGVEPKQVKFSDGLRPGTSLTPPDASSGAPQTEPQGLTGLEGGGVVTECETSTVDSSSVSKADIESSSEAVPCVTSGMDLTYVHSPSPMQFKLSTNLVVSVTQLNLDCCVGRVCWCFITTGLCTVGQDEVFVVLECLDDETTLPRDVFSHLAVLYDRAARGSPVTHLGHTLVAPEGLSFLGSRDHAGFLYVRPSFQCVGGLPLPPAPHLCAVLVQRAELPWLRMFPVRLMLRLGAEYRYYPCPLVSVRGRAPVYRAEVGHTILNLLMDLRTYRYGLARVEGLVIHVQDLSTTVWLPRHAHASVVREVGEGDDHLLALAADFSTSADSHLVCAQSVDGRYETQAINIENKPRLLTGASFIVFNAIHKTPDTVALSHGTAGTDSTIGTGVTCGVASSVASGARCSIVEDGLMVQTCTETISALRRALLDRRDFVLRCSGGSVEVGGSPGVDGGGTGGRRGEGEEVRLQWTDDKIAFNVGVESPIDGMPLEGIASRRVHSTPDCLTTTRHAIHWTETFYVALEPDSQLTNHVEEQLAQACCMALNLHLERLHAELTTAMGQLGAQPVRIGLRVCLSRMQVSYEIGAQGCSLPTFCMEELDDSLIRVLNASEQCNSVQPTVLELFFYLFER